MSHALAQRTTSDAGTGETPASVPARRRLLARIAFAAIAVAAGLAIVFGFLFFAIVSLRQRSVEARHSQQVIATANSLQTLVIDLETSLRGFAITRDERYLVPWRDAQRRYPAAIQELIQLTSDNRLQHERALSIKAAIHTYLETYSRPLVSYMRRNPLVLPIVVTSRQGAEQVEAIRNQFSRFLDTERALREDRNERARSTARNALVVGGVGLGSALLLILVGALYLNGAVAQPVRMTAEAAARIAGGDLTSRLRTDGPGEVGELERAFNSMAASLERTLADLEERNRTLVESERVKGELVSNVSHELRTPLASVLGFSTLMLERELPPEEVRRYLEVIRTEARRLAALLNDLLDLQRVEQQTLELRLTDIDLNELLETQVTLYSAQSEAHDLRFQPAAERLLVRGDPDRLAQVVGNLLSSAIKYSPAGGPVDVAAGLIGEDATVWIRDDGLGIPESHQDQIFTKFFRGDVGREQGIPGTGLGLVLAQQIVEAHGGEVGFESREGAGSTFWFRLPAAELPAEPLAAGDDANVRGRI
jgi:signal transduction histidine kinase